MLIPNPMIFIAPILLHTPQRNYPRTEQVEVILIDSATRFTKRGGKRKNKHHDY